MQYFTGIKSGDWVTHSCKICNVSCFQTKAPSDFWEFFFIIGPIFIKLYVELNFRNILFLQYFDFGPRIFF